jgi:coenzyme F420 hydrogenase subunit beta
LSRPTLERFVFGRERKPEEEFGVYQSVLVARSTDRNVLKVCQDGGVVTALLTFAIKNKIIDGAAVSGIDRYKPLYPVPIFATTPEQILQCAGTRYFYSPNLLALKRGIEQDRKHVAFVGSPCQIETVRRMQIIPLKNYVERLKLTIGLMCSKSFSYKGLVENYIKTKLGINPNNIGKINIKSKFILEMKSGETKKIPIKSVRQYARTNCSWCKDFSAELADISIGGTGLNGWSLVVVRTETAKKLFTDAMKSRSLEVGSIKEKKRSLDLLISLSENKRMRGKK